MSQANDERMRIAKECELLTVALYMAIVSPTADGCESAVKLAGSIAAGLLRSEVRQCQREAKRRLDAIYN